MIILNLTLEEVNAILAGLGKLPYEAVFQVVNKVQQQAQEQLKAQAADQQGA